MLSRFKNALGRRLDDAKERVQGLRGHTAAEPPAYRPPVDLSKAAPRPPAPTPIIVQPTIDVKVEAPPEVVVAPPVVTPPPSVVAAPAPPVETAAVAAVPSKRTTKQVAPDDREAERLELARKAGEDDAAEKAAEAAHAATAAKKAAEPKKVEEGSSLAARALALAKGQGENKMVHADMGSTDLEHYIARAKANGRDLSTIKGSVGLNKNDDGSTFWGPVDNTSSRAKAEGKLLTVDQWECISCGTCVEQTDKVFYLPADGKATPIAQDGPMDLIEDAIEACPVTCIHWVTPDDAADRGLATGLEADSPRPE